jgi:dUTP pyrophosphatase
MQEVLQFSKVHNVKSPTRGTSLSAGLDFYMPEGDKKFVDALMDNNSWMTSKHLFEEPHAKMNYVMVNTGVLVPPHTSILIPSGIHVKFPNDLALIAHNKSGIATKKNLDIGACVVDADYEGQVHLHLTNTTDKNIFIAYGEKLVQFLLMPVVYLDAVEVENVKELYADSSSERGEGGFGSTGK